MTIELEPNLLHRFGSKEGTFALVTSESSNEMKFFTPMETITSTMRTSKSDRSIWIRHSSPPHKTNNSHYSIGLISTSWSSVYNRAESNKCVNPHLTGWLNTTRLESGFKLSLVRQGPLQQPCFSHMSKHTTILCLLSC